MNRIDPCSTEAYVAGEETGTFQDMRKKVLDLFDEFGDMTGEEVRQRYAAKYGNDTESENIRNRVTENTDLGYLEKVGKVTSANGKTQVNVWRRTKLAWGEGKTNIKAARPKKVPAGLFDEIKALVEWSENYALSNDNPELREAAKDLLRKLKEIQ